MTDQTAATPESGPDEMDDLELITSYLNKHLSPEMAAEVERRLEEDEAFRELSWPVFLAWSVPLRRERKPLPEGELERGWEEFVKRTGFGQRTQEPNAQQEPGASGAPRGPQEPHVAGKSRWRRPWTRGFLSVALLFLGAVAFVAWSVLKPVRSLDRTLKLDFQPAGEFADVPYDTGWISIGDSIQVRLSPGTRLVRDTLEVDDVTTIMADGNARFRVAAFRARAPEPRRSVFKVYTRAGYVYAGEAEFILTVRGDTTDVVALPAARTGMRGYLHYRAVIDSAGWQFPRKRQFFDVEIGDRDRIEFVRNEVPALYRNSIPRRLP